MTTVHDAPSESGPNDTSRPPAAQAQGHRRARSGARPNSRNGRPRGGDANVPDSSAPRPGDGAFLLAQAQGSGSGTGQVPMPGPGDRARQERTRGASGGRSGGGQGRQGGLANGHGGGGGAQGVLQNGDANPPSSSGAGLTPATAEGKRRRNRTRKPRPAGAGAGAGAGSMPTSGAERPHDSDGLSRSTTRSDGGAVGQAAVLDPSAPAFAPRGPSGSGGAGQLSRNSSQRKNGSTPHAGKPAPPHVPPPTNSRKAAFKGRLTSDDAGATPASLEADAMERAATGTGGAHQRVRTERAGGGRSGRRETAVVIEADDLASKLMRGLSMRPFLECPICFSPLLPSQPIWSCLPQQSRIATGPSSSLACCYTPFHLSCMQDWASRSLKEAEIKRLDRIRDGGSRDDLEPLTWRCPGCQTHRQGQVDVYACFCGAVRNLKTHGGHGQPNGGHGKHDGAGSALATPHSCGQSCARKRAYCDHPCPNACHPGPCPPCQVPLVVPCPSHDTPLTVKCSVARGANLAPPVCDEPCNRVKSCGNAEHRCADSCHEPPCETCDVIETAVCFCGEDSKEVPCGWNREQETECERVVLVDGQETVKRWQGRWACGRKCSRLYDCDVHVCEQTCHPHPSEPLICPTSPAIITHCPCGSCSLETLGAPPRTKCTDPIPTCGQRCPQPLSGCDHACALDCHQGDCPPCQVDVVVPCRCGESKVTMKCYEQRQADGQVLCDRVCQVMRTCGRHACSRRCCPLSYKAKYKGKRRDLSDPAEDESGLHDCPLPCGKLLGCGLHHCSQLDHKGACGRCLEASYEELVCHCGHTVLSPPIRCGTVLQCTYPCARPPPACGHPRLASHTCHEREDCPPCPYLTTKACACGKNSAVKNVRCSQERVSCGATCGKLLSCGGHRCTRPCHGEDCGPCDQICRKRKKLCQHPHDDGLCHAPSSCPEDTPCPTIVTQSCPCGHLQQRATCGACEANPVSKEKTPLKCVAECAQRQRNARLAEALGITPTEKQVEYSAELKSFATQNHAFVITVEKAFNDFFMGPKQAMVLPQAPVVKRLFILGLAEMYRFGTEEVDADPHRSVQIRRRIDSRIPKPLLSAATAAPAAAKRQLGSLGDFKKVAAGGGSSLGATASHTTGAPLRPVPRAWASQPGTPRLPTSSNALSASTWSQRPTPLPSPRPEEPGRTIAKPNDDGAPDWDASDAE